MKSASSTTFRPVRALSLIVVVRMIIFQREDAVQDWRSARRKHGMRSVRPVSAWSLQGRLLCVSVHVNHIMKAAMRAMVMLPTYNEKLNIENMVGEILKHDGVSIVVVDDSSPD